MNRQADLHLATQELQDYRVQYSGNNHDLPDAQTDLAPKFIEFIYLPLSIILNRNGPPAPPLPDQVLQKIFQATALLCQQWWWAMDYTAWEQLFRLSAYLIGGSKAGPGVSLAARSEETKEAAALCLEALLRQRSDQERPSWAETTSDVRMEYFTSQAKEQNRFPMIGSAIGSLLDATESDKISLRALSFRIVGYLLADYVPRGRLPTFLPGVVGKCCRVAVARKTSKGWEASDVVKEALTVLKIVIVGSIGDEVCEEEGLVRTDPTSFEDIANMASLSTSGISVNNVSTRTDPYAFQRTESWLQASASQIHNAINSLTPILSHPTTSAQVALANLSFSLLKETLRTIPTLQPLLLSHLLMFSVSTFPSLSNTAKSHLESLFTSPKCASSPLDILAKITQENLLALPSLILARSDSKVERVCNQIEATCKLSCDPVLSNCNFGVGHLLGPTGGIERWGLGLLGVVELALPSRHSSIISQSAPVGFIMDDLDKPEHPFPTTRLRYVEETSTQLAVERMLRGLGAAGGVDALFSIEWFVEVATAGRGPIETSALWCAARIYEGIFGTVLVESSIRAEEQGDRMGDVPMSYRMTADARRRLEKTARTLVKTISELWEMDPVEREETAGNPSQTSDALTLYGDSMLPTEHIKGLDPLVTVLDVRNRRNISIPSAGTQKTSRDAGETAKLHAALSLQALSISASVLGPRFPPLLLYALYPVLRSMVSSDSFLASTAMAALHHISTASAYASPANLLLSNFDYALDSASRRLLKSRLDLKATKVLVILVRLVGKDVVQRAGDVVEECFDRLDEYHGYSVIVEGLVEVLNEVVRAVEAEEETADVRHPSGQPDMPAAQPSIGTFIEWYKQRTSGNHFKDGTEDFGPAPQRAWAQQPQPDDGDPNVRPTSLSNDSPKPSITQAPISKIIRRCLPFLTHSSPLIRARMLSLLRSASSVLPEHEIGPAIHLAWPFILNRLKDSQPFVVTEAARLIESLCWNFWEFMSSRIHQDVWPAYRRMLESLEAGDRESALTARRQGPETPYSHSHRLYSAMLNTLNSVFAAPRERNWIKDEMTWDIAVKCRRFLSASANKELQETAKALYQNLGKQNGDLVWLVLCATCGTDPRQTEAERVQGLPPHLRQPKWDISANASIVLNSM
ncbi:hypothetical protein FRB90_009087 [Tulasnella sp. 427]|nr:hypothetical protein FRB90_009087 [Tulasnella sp. 427]